MMKQSAIRLGGLLLVALTLGPLPSPAASSAESSPSPSAFILEGVTVIDGTGSAPAEDRYVLVEAGRIGAVGPMAKLEVPSAVERVNLRGHFVLPGLIDMHAHALVPRCQLANRFDRAVSERMLQVLLEFGITTARSPASPTSLGVRMREAVASGAIRGPRLLVSAELINGVRLTPEDVRWEVRSRLREPVDFVKLYSSLGPEAVKAGIEEAHARGVPVIGHLGQTTWRGAAEMGIDAITHAVSWSTDDLPPEAREQHRRALVDRGFMKARIDWLESFEPEGPQSDRTLEELSKRRIVVDPTLVAFDSKFLSPDEPRYRQNPNRAVVPEMLRDWERCGTGTDDWSPADFSRMQAAWPKLLRWVKRMHEAGVLLTAGSDVTNPWVIPGESLHQELELLVSAGIEPIDVLRIATRNGAEALGLLKELGTLEPGKRADLLVLERDPAADISNTRSLVAVLQGGRWVRSDNLPRRHESP